VGKCPNCENKGWFLKTYRCFICGKEGCDKCFHTLFSVQSIGRIYGTWWVCSEACSRAFERKLESTVPPDAINLANYPSDVPHPEQYPCPSIELFNEALKNIAQEADEGFAKKFLKFDAQIVVLSDIEEQFKRYCDLKQAGNLEKAGRRDEAAKILIRVKRYCCVS